MEQQQDTCTIHQGERLTHCCLNSSCLHNRLACADCLIESWHSAHSRDLIKFSLINTLFLKTKGIDCEKVCLKLQNTFDELSDLFNAYINGIKTKFIITQEKFDSLSAFAKNDVIKKLLKYEDLKQNIETQFFHLPNLLISQLENFFVDLQLYSNLNRRRLTFAFFLSGNYELTIETLPYFHIEDNLLQVSNDNFNKGLKLMSLLNLFIIFAEDKYQEAEKLFERSLRINPRNVQIIRWKGETLIFIFKSQKILKQEKFEEADNCFESLLQQDNENLQALYGRCLCLIQMKFHYKIKALERIPEAIEFCQKVLKQNSFIGARQTLIQMLHYETLQTGFKSSQFVDS